MRTHQWLAGLGVAAGLLGCDRSGMGDGAPRGPGPAEVYPSADGDAGRPGRAPSRGPIGSEEEPGDFVDPNIKPPPRRLPEKPIRAATPPPAISGGTLEVSASGAYAVASDPDRDAIHVLRLADNHVTTLPLARGAEPGRVAIDPADVAHVILRGSGQLARIDLARPEELTSKPVCELPRGIGYVKSDDSVAIACASGDLVRVAASDHAERSRSFIDTDLRDVIVTRDGKLMISRYRTAQLLEVSAAGTLAARSQPKGRTVVRAGGFVQQTSTMQPALAWRLVPTGDEHLLMLHQQAQREEVQPLAGGYGGMEHCSAITQPAVSIVGSEPGKTGREFALGGAALAVDLALSPNQEWLATAVPSGFLPARPTLFLYSAVTPESSPPMGAPGFNVDAGVVAPPTTSPPPMACALPVHSDGYSSQVTAVAFMPDGRLIAQSREPAELQILEFTTLAAVAGGSAQVRITSTQHIPLGGISVRDSGHEVFHADTGGGIACASCHGEMGDDAHVWTFGGIGPRRTQSLRGGLKGTEPFHWDGDMVTFSHLVDSVFTGRMSGFTVAKPFAEATMSWMDAQPALRLPVTDVPAVARGKEMFESKGAGCTTCHSGIAMTNNLSFDVGTGGKFQVPALRGLGLRAPFMHDGCAASLSDRFTNKHCGGGDNHGKTSHLSAEQLRDLTAYLQTL